MIKDFTKLKKGDIVCSKGLYAWSVIWANQYTLNVKPAVVRGYKTATSNRTRSYEYPRYEHWTLLNEEVIKQKELENMEKLYEFTHEGNTLYGTKMAVNSAGLWVMDVKGSQPVAIEKDACREVIPYSVYGKYLDGGNSEHFTTEQKDVLKVGGMYITDKGKLVTIIKVDTETKTTNELKVVARILTEAVK